MNINLPRAVESFPNVNFFQPLYEAVVNSIEAEATNIKIIIHSDQNTLDNVDASIINGFEIIDDGHGFTKENIDSFLEYLSERKIHLGCKGVGRISLLKVFSLVEIESYTGINKVHFKFDINFSKNKINIEKSDLKKITKVKMSVPKNDYSTKNRFKNVNFIREKLIQELTVKLFLHYNDNKELKIEICHINETAFIDKYSIPKLEKTSFKIKPSLLDSISFDLFYNFFNDNKSLHCHSICAHGRKVENIKKEVIPRSFPEKTSSFFLLCSPYLDSQVSVARNEFKSNFSDSEKNSDVPITLETLMAKLKKEVYSIITSNFPNIIDKNNKIVDKCIETYPYLEDYIENERESLVSEQDLIKNAKKKFDEDKENTKKEFIKLLSSKNINYENFLNQTRKISDIASKELAEYIVYREQIIDAIHSTYEAKKSETEYYESFLHNLFMQMGEMGENKSPYDANLWLLDDKFMGYSNAFSDKKIKVINDEIIRNIKEEDSSYEPDLAIFYSNYSGMYDIVVIEFKSASCKRKEKVYAISELARNIKDIVCQHDNIRIIYGYVITTIDTKTANEIDAIPGVRPLYSSKSTPYFYQYNDKVVDKNDKPVDCHMYIISTETIEKDARARNKTFLDILTKK